MLGLFRAGAPLCGWLAGEARLKHVCLHVARVLAHTVSVYSRVCTRCAFVRTCVFVCVCVTVSQAGLAGVKGGQRPAGPWTRQVVVSSGGPWGLGQVGDGAQACGGQAVGGSAKGWCTGADLVPVPALLGCRGSGAPRARGDERGTRTRPAAPCDFRERPHVTPGGTKVEEPGLDLLEAPTSVAHTVSGPHRCGRRLRCKPSKLTGA